MQNEQFPRRHFYVPFGEFVHLHMQYYSFANTILKCAAFQFFTPARKSTINFYLDVFKKRNKKVDTHHIRKYNKHKQNQYIKSYSIFYAIRQENPQIKSLHEAAEKLCNGIFWSNTIVREEISIQFKVFAENVKIQLRYKTDGFVYR